MSWLWVALGAAVGAPARYLTDRAVQSRLERSGLQARAFPAGTLSVNLAGSLLLGLLAGAGPRLDPAVYAALGTGFCGALTTYSTFSYETFRLIEERHVIAAISYPIVSLTGGLGVLALGWAIGNTVR